jgi:hypothetical protein
MHAPKVTLTTQHLIQDTQKRERFGHLILVITDYVPIKKTGPVKHVNLRDLDDPPLHYNAVLHHQVNLVTIADRLVHG